MVNPQQPYGPPPGYGPPQQPYGYRPPQQPYGYRPPQQPYGYRPPQQPYGPPPQSFVQLPYPLAEPGTRILQGLIDAFLQILPAIFGQILVIAAIAGAVNTESGALIGVSVVVYLLTILAAWGLSFWNHVYRPAKTGTDQTVGMSRRNLKVMRLDGRPLSMGDHALRWLLLVAIDAGIVGLVMVLATERRQRLGDLAARTVVVQLPDVYAHEYRTEPYDR